MSNTKAAAFRKYLKGLSRLNKVIVEAGPETGPWLYKAVVWETGKKTVKLRVSTPSGIHSFETFMLNTGDREDIIPGRGFIGRILEPTAEALAAYESQPAERKAAIEPWA